MRFFCNLITLLTFLPVILNEYKSTCPTLSQWRLRKIGYCKIFNQSLHYTCSYDTEHNSIVESCTLKPDFAPPGQKYVWTGGLRNIDCSSGRFQPFVLFQSESDHCVYKKSTCNEEGQTVYENRNLLEDRACRCDYTKGYVFVTKPEHMCYCIPTQEECSCYKNTCSNNEVLISDYRCVVLNDHNIIESQCPEIPGESLTHPPTNNTSTKVQMNEEEEEQFVFRLWLPYLSIVIVLLVIAIVKAAGYLRTQSMSTKIENVETTQFLVNDESTSKCLSIEDLKTRSVAQENDNILTSEETSVLSIDKDCNQESLSVENSQLSGEKVVVIHSEPECVTDEHCLNDDDKSENLLKTQSFTKETEKTPVLIDNDESTIRRSTAKIFKYDHLSSKHTSLTKWRRGLKASLKCYVFDEAEAQICLDYILETFENAITSAKVCSFTRENQIREIRKPDQVPNNLTFKNWILIIQGVGLLQDPVGLDSQNDIHRTAVFLPKQPNIETFREFTNLLRLIKGCNWTVLQTLLDDFSEEQCHALLQLLERCLEKGNLQETDRGYATNLYKCEPFLMTQIGFTRKSPAEPLIWCLSQNTVHVASILNALFGHLTRPLNTYQTR